MTITTTINKVSAVGDGIQTNFPYNFKVTDADQMLVYLDNVLYVGSYTVNGVGNDAGGSVDIPVPPGIDVVVLLYRSVEDVQETDYKPYRSFPSQTTEDDFDLAVMRDQQIQEQLGRSVKGPISDDGSFDYTLPPLVTPGLGIKVNATADGFIETTYDPDEAQTDSAASAAAALVSENNAAASAAAAGSAICKRNKIINGGFDVWQRGTTFLGLGSTGVYTADRWLFDGGTAGADHDVIQGKAVIISTVVPQPTFYLSAECVATAGITVLAQRVENVRTLSDTTTTVSFWGRTDVGTRDVDLTLRQNFGSGGSPSSTVNIGGGTKTFTADWQKFTIVFTVPSLTGKTIGTDENSYLQFEMSYTAVAGDVLNFAQVQLEEGPGATPFDQRNIGDELALCQRYFFRKYSTDSFSIFCPCMNTTSTASVGAIPLPVSMRASPAIGSSGSFRLLSPGAHAGVTVSAYAYVSKTALNVSVGNVSGLVTSDNAMLTADSDSSAYIDGDAEL